LLYLYLEKRRGFEHIERVFRSMVPEVEEVGLETKVKRLSATKEFETVKQFLEEGGTLGEAWYSGLIGGTP